MPRFQVPSLDSSVVPATSDSTWKTGLGDQVERSTSAHVSLGSTRARLAAMPPPVTWLRACTPSPTAGIGDEAQQRSGVEPGRLEQRLAPRRAEVGGAIAVLDAGAGDDVAHERVAVGVQAARGEGEDRVARLDAVRAEQGVGLDDPGRGAGHVVVVRAEQTRVLGGLAADQRGAGLAARVGDAAHDVGDPLRHDLAARDVVGHEQRAARRPRRCRRRPCRRGPGPPCRACRSPGRSPPSCRPRRCWSRAGAAVGAQRTGVEHAGEAADAALHLGTVRRAHGGLHQLDGEIARRRVDARIGVGGTARAPMPVDGDGVRGFGGRRRRMRGSQVPRAQPTRRSRVADPRRCGRAVVESIA